MEAWQASHYHSPRLVPFDARLADDGQIVVLTVDAQEYEVQFEGIEGQQILDSVLSMADPNALIWSDIAIGTALPWQTSLVQQLDELSLVQGDTADHSAMTDHIAHLTKITKQAAKKLADATANKPQHYAPVVAEFLRLLDAPAPLVDQFSIDEIGSSSMRDNFAIQTFFLQKLYVEENLPIVIPIWKNTLHLFAHYAGFNPQTTLVPLDGNITSFGFYCSVHIEAYLLCLINLVLLAPNAEAKRRFASYPTITSTDTGVNFMRRAEQFALSGLAVLGESRYVSKVNEESATFGPLVQGVFIEQYHITQRFVEIIAPLMTKRSRSPIKQRTYKYFQEELGHEVFERATCEALGVSSTALYDALPLPLFQAYVDTFTVLGRYDPIGYVSSIMVTEGMLGVDNPLHHRLEELTASRADYQKVAKRHDDLNLELNHASLSRLFFCEISVITPEAQQRALSNLAFLLELNVRAMDQTADFYGAQSDLIMCSLSTYPASCV